MSGADGRETLESEGPGTRGAAGPKMVGATRQDRADGFTPISRDPCRDLPRDASGAGGRVEALPPQQDIDPTRHEVQWLAEVSGGDIGAREVLSQDEL